LNPAFILDLSDTGYATAKCLANQGFDMYGVHTTKYNPIAQHSSFLKKSFVHQNTSFEKTLDILLNEASFFTEKPVLFIASDPMVEFVSRFAEKLKPHFIMPYSDKYLIHDLMSKKEMGLVASAAGLKVPNNQLVIKGNSFDDILDTTIYPAFVKPENSLEGYKDMMGIAKDRDSLKKLLSDKFVFCNRLLVSEYIPGDVTSLFETQGFLRSDNIPYTPLVVQKLRQYPDMLIGSGTFLQTINDSVLQNLSNKFLKELSFFGPVDIDFKRHAITGEYYFIEANYRLSGNVEISKAAGVNIPLQYYLQSLKNIHYPSQGDAGVQWVDDGRDWKHVVEGTISKKELFDSYTNLKAFSVFDSSDRNVFNLARSNTSHEFFSEFKEELGLDE